tara:strand:+ start:73 stop:819 length:747 start_codon:yes stop_codon:yes gene_type:complete
MPNQAKPKAGSIPDLSGLISKEDLHKKGSFATYMNWARTTQYLRENAPGWEFHLEHKNEEYVWPSPDGSGYLMCFFQNGEKKTPLFPFPIMDNRNNPLPLEKISARDVSDSHRRGLCACAAFVFGLAYELWARIEIEEAEKADAAPVKKEIARSPQRGANARQVKPSPVAHEMVTGKVAETPKVSLTQSQSNQIKKFMTAHPDGWEGIVKAFNDQFNKTGDKISQSITTQEQITFILERITGYENLSR